MDYLTRSQTTNEVVLLRMWVRDGLIQKGIPVQFYQINQKTPDIYEDPAIQYLPAVPAHLVPEAQIELQSLELGGWFGDADDAMPLLVSIPYYDDNGNVLVVREGCKITFTYEMFTFKTKDFIIHKVIQHSHASYFYKANLIPDRPAAFVEDPGTRGNYMELE